MGLIGLLFTVATLACQGCGLVFNLLVLSSCEFLESSSGDGEFRFGVWKYAVNVTSNEFDTGGECEDLSDLFAKDEIDWKYRTAQVCSIIAPTGGAVVVLATLLSQCVCPVPMGDKLVGLGYTLANIGTSLVWLVKTNEVCSTLLGGCEWGEAATFCLIAQIAYIIASIMHNFLPDPKVRQVERNAARQQKQQDAQHNAEMAEQGNATAAASKDNDAMKTQLTAANNRVKELEAENAKVKKALAAETAKVESVEAANATKMDKLQKEHEMQIQELEQENKKTKTALAAATTATSTAAAAEAVKIKKQQDELEALQKEKDALQNELDQSKEAQQKAAEQLRTVEEESDKTKKALAIATAATSTAAGAEALKIKNQQEELEDLKLKNKDLQRELDESKEAQQKASEELRSVQEESEKTKKALAIATAATSTAAAAEPVKIKKQQDELAALQQKHEDLQKELDQSKEAQQKAAEQLLTVQEESDKTKKALAIATAATSTAAGAEALKIKKQQDELDALQNKHDELQRELDESKEAHLKAEEDLVALQEDHDKMKKTLTGATAGTATVAAVEAAKMKKQQDDLEEFQKKYDELQREMQGAKQTEQLSQTEEGDPNDTDTDTDTEKNTAILGGGSMAVDPAYIKQLQDVVVDLQNENKELKGQLGIVGGPMEDIEVIVESTSGDPPEIIEGDEPTNTRTVGESPPGIMPPISGSFVRRLEDENENLKTELDDVKHDYDDKLHTMEETEMAVREDLVSQIDELQHRNKKGEKALAAARALSEHEKEMIQTLMKENKHLKHKIKKMKKSDQVEI